MTISFSSRRFFFVDGHKIEQYVDRGKHVYICWMVCVCVRCQDNFVCLRVVIWFSEAMKKLNWTNLVLGVSARCCHYTYAVGKGSEAELVRGVTSVCVCVPNSMFIDTAVVVASDVGRRTSTCSRTISTVKSLKWLSMFTCFWGVASHRMAMKWIFIAKAFFFLLPTRVPLDGSDGCAIRARVL